MSRPIVTKADLRDAAAAIRALERIAERHGENDDGDWHEYDFDPLSNARGLIADWRSEHETS